MQVESRSIREIKPYERNPRSNDGAVDAVAASIKEFGWQQPIVVDKDGVIIDGHTRYKAAKKLGLKEVPVVVAENLTEEQVKAYRLADNKTGELAEWDFSALEEELAGIAEIDMSQFGFDANISPDAFGDAFSLPDGGKNEIVQMTFTLHERQKELIEYAMGIAADEIGETFGNTNKNGNALYEVVRQWAWQRKSL